MKRYFILAAGAVLVAAAVSAFVYVNNEKNESMAFFKANVEVLAKEEGSGYDCPGACLTWTGSTGGGIDCICHRYVGRCKKWCD